MMSGFNTAINISSASSSVPLLGYFIGWHMTGGAALQSRTEELLKQHNLLEDVHLPRVGVTAAYRRSVLKAVQTGKRSERLYDVVRLSETDTEITHAIVRKDTVDKSSRLEGGELAPGGEVDLDVVFTVGFDKSRRGAPGVNPLDLLRFDEAAQGHDLAKHITNLYTKLAVEYSANDIRTAFQDTLERWDAFRAIPQGGMWFAPKDKEHKIKAWQAFMKDMGHAPLVVPIFDTRESKEQLAVLAKNTLEGQLKELKEQLAEFKSTGRTLRASTYEDRLSKLKELQGRAMIYKDLLNSEVSELTEMVSVARDDILEDLNNLV